MLESLLNEYGYPILLLGTFFEGETVLILGGVAAHMGYLSIGWVITCGFVGTLFGDQLYFLIGRRHGAGFLARRPTWQARSQQVYRIMERYPVLLIFGFRFIYGIRTVTPFAIGMSNISYLRFASVRGSGPWSLASPGSILAMAWKSCWVTSSITNSQCWPLSLPWAHSYGLYFCSGGVKLAVEWFKTIFCA